MTQSISRLPVTERQYTVMLGPHEVTIKTGKLAPLSNGAVTVQMGETVLLVTAVMDEPREGIPFFPLRVDFEERLYAAGRIPGSFFRREGRPSESATLLMRLIDRSLRPLFPKGFRNDVQIMITALSYDEEHSIDPIAVIGASAALTISDIPFNGPIGHTRISMDDEGELLINPTISEYQKQGLDLRVSGTSDAINMVECSATEVEEDRMIEALALAHETMQPIIELQQQMREELGKPKASYTVFGPDEAVENEVREWLGDKVEVLISETETKESRNVATDQLTEQLIEAFIDPETGELKHSEQDLKDAFDIVLKETVRRRILENGERPDSRQTDEVRPLYTDVNLSPRAHGSGLFQRGLTQVLSLATLGTVGEEQMLDDLGVRETKRYLHHYNFPPFSVGETKPLRGPSRREIGHGALSEGAIRPMLPDEEDFPYTVRVVSEVLSSNGSTSMASVCASTLALMDAGVPIKAPVAGIAMGLIKDANSDNYKILTDIQGFEDHLGDMDFKVAGTEQGINALQMDIKVKGLDMEVLRKALYQAREARMQILETMLDTISEPREELSRYAPRIFTIQISTDKIGKLIGPGSKTVGKIQDETGVRIDIDDDGTVFIAAEDGEAAQAARDWVNRLTEEVELGKIYTGKVVRTTNYGAFVEILPGQDGLVHISQLADRHIPNVEDVARVGDEIMVMVTNIDNEGKVRLSRQAVLEGWTLEEARANDSGVSSGNGRRGNRRGKRR